MLLGHGKLRPVLVNNDSSTLKSVPSYSWDLRLVFSDSLVLVLYSSNVDGTCFTPDVQVEVRANRNSAFSISFYPTRNFLDRPLIRMGSQRHSG